MKHCQRPALLEPECVQVCSAGHEDILVTVEHASDRGVARV